MRWLKFNAVGAMGWGVHLGLLGFFVHALGIHYLPSTALAVELAVLHNFAWHWRWTWADRQSVAIPPLGRTLLRFHLTNGAVSIVGNLFFMRVLTGVYGIEPILASLLSIGPCSVANFFLSDRLVFQTPGSSEVPERCRRPAHGCAAE